LLAASIGLVTMTVGACDGIGFGRKPVVGNLMAPPPCSFAGDSLCDDAGADSGPSDDAGPDGGVADDAGPNDAGDADAGTSGDGGA
jgi:hypothetical protein